MGQSSSTEKESQKQPVKLYSDDDMYKVVFFTTTTSIPEHIEPLPNFQCTPKWLLQNQTMSIDSDLSSLGLSHLKEPHRDVHQSTTEYDKPTIGYSRHPFQLETISENTVPADVPKQKQLVNSWIKKDTPISDTSDLRSVHNAINEIVSESLELTNNFQYGKGVEQHRPTRRRYEQYEPTSEMQTMIGKGRDKEILSIGKQYGGCGCALGSQIHRVQEGRGRQDSTESELSVPTDTTFNDTDDYDLFDDSTTDQSTLSYMSTSVSRSSTIPSSDYFRSLRRRV